MIESTYIGYAPPSRVLTRTWPGPLAQDSTARQLLGPDRDDLSIMASHGATDGRCLDRDDVEAICRDYDEACGDLVLAREQAAEARTARDAATDRADQLDDALDGLRDGIESALADLVIEQVTSANLRRQLASVRREVSDLRHETSELRAALTDAHASAAISHALVRVAASIGGAR